MNGKNKLAFVTGTSSGIGLSLVKQLVKDQWQVCGLSRRPAAFGADSYTHLQIDLADLENLPGQILENWQSKLHQQTWQTVALVNNAALIGALRWMQQTDATHLGRIFAVNAAAPAYLMGWLAKETDASQSIRVVNISSGAAHTPFPGLGDYSATKAALRLSGQTLAKEFQFEGRTANQAAVFSFEPGVVDTTMQVQARATSPDDFPAHDTFMGFSEKGILVAPELVIEDVLKFLNSDPGNHYSESRFESE